MGGLRRIILTASGGAFRDWPVEKLKEVGGRRTGMRCKEALEGCEGGEAVALRSACGVAAAQWRR